MQLPLPSSAGDRPSYLEAYNGILAAHRRAPLSSASSVIILVAPDVDALCASRMLAMLFKQDDIAYRIIPISGIYQLMDEKEQLKDNPDLHTLLLLNMGGDQDLATDDWFSEFDLKVTVHVIDSGRPQSLYNLFVGGENADRILVWDDGDPSKLADERISYEITEFQPVPDSEEDSSGNEEENEELSSEDDEQSDTNHALSLDNKRKIDHLTNTVRKRRRKVKDQPRTSSNEYNAHKARVKKYYNSGGWHGQSAASTVYILATVLERTDNDFLWLAILGLTFQYITSLISRESYEKYQMLYFDEVSRLNPQPERENTPISVNPDDVGVRRSDELRFMLFRHWTLYDAMFHSSFVASKLGIWKEKGRQRLTGLLAKMGFSIPQTQQPYSHMDMDLKKTLIQKLNDIAPEYDLVELSYPSFTKCYGFHSQPLSAADAVEGLSALLDVAEGIRMEVEVEGMRNGGEWFGGGRLWEANKSLKNSNTLLNGDSDQALKLDENKNPGERDKDLTEERKWWVKNFWKAYDSVSDIRALKESLNLSMSLHRAIVRQGTSIIDKQDIRTMRNHRVVVLTQGPDLPLFCHPGVLIRLALWLTDALRDRLPGTMISGTKKKSLPFIVACLNERKGQYIVVGVLTALEFGQIHKNAFTTAFREAEANLATVRINTFNGSILEIDQEYLKVFLERLC